MPKQTLGMALSIWNVALDWHGLTSGLYTSLCFCFLGYQHFQIDVDISLLRFTHQSLFSKEHILETRLQLLYSYYQARKASGIQDYNNNKVRNILKLRETLLFWCFRGVLKWNNGLKWANPFLTIVPFFFGWFSLFCSNYSRKLESIEIRPS